MESQQKDKFRKVQTVLVDPWARTSNFGQTRPPLSPKSSNSLPDHLSYPGQLQFTNPLDNYSNNHRNHVTHGKFIDVSDNRVRFRSRQESDPIDRGDIPTDALNGKMESLENALDQIYRKMKTELSDVRDSLKLLNRYSESSPSLVSPRPRTNNGHSFSYPRTTDQVNV